MRVVDGRAPMLGQLGHLSIGFQDVMNGNYLWSFGQSIM